MTHSSGARHAQSVGLDREGSTLAFAAMVRLVRLWVRCTRTVLDLGKTFSVNSTRFRNGSSVTDCVYPLTCCFVFLIGGWPRGHFASASRFANTSLDDCAYCAVRCLDGWSSRVTGPAVDRC
jgi:hypothetical protein